MYHILLPVLNQDFIQNFFFHKLNIKHYFVRLYWVGNKVIAFFGRKQKTNLKYKKIYLCNAIFSIVITSSAIVQATL